MAFPPAVTPTGNKLGVVVHRGPPGEEEEEENEHENHHESLDESGELVVSDLRPLLVYVRSKSLCWLPHD